VVKGLLILGLTVAPLAVSGAAQAGEVRYRELREQKRIFNGVADHQLNRSQFGYLERHLDRIDDQRVYDLQTNGGRLTPKEYRQLNARENWLSNRIYQFRR